MATTTRRPPQRRSAGSRAASTGNRNRSTGSRSARSTTSRSAATRNTASRSRSTSTNRRPEIEVVRSGPSAEAMLLGSVAVLCLLGLVMVYSASSVASVQGGGSSWQVVMRQFMFMSAGLLLAVGAARIPLRVWRDRLSAPLLLVAIALQAVLALDVVLRAIGGPGVPFAISVNGATRWLGVGVMRGQPSDVAKLALILWLAKLLDVRARDIGSPDLLKPVLAITGLLGAFVMAGDDLGTTLLLGVIMLTMLFLAGAPVRQVAAIACAGLASAVIVLFAFEGFRLQRISAFLSPDDHVATEGWQLLQSQIGFASGGFWGNGPGNSRAKWGYLPEADTDFILAVIGEELGLIGSLVVLGAFVVFMLAGIRIALRCNDRFGRLVAFGITTWIGVQALINIGVTVGTLPTKGITLPFVSYGGSSLMMCMLAVGVLMSVARAR